MNRPAIYPNDWLQIHPYRVQQPSDGYFVDLANQLYKVCDLPKLSLAGKKRVCLYLAAYLEDQISGLGLWKSFVEEHERLYGAPLPFYSLSADYVKEEVNVEDVCFLIWNTWQKDLTDHGYVYPLEKEILQQAEKCYALLAEAYEEAPENGYLEGFFRGFDSMQQADAKLTWLFGHTYLTEPSMLPYIERVKPNDRFIIPVGPLALFLHEWVDRLGGEACWRTVTGLYFTQPLLPEEMKRKNRELYERFTEATGGENIVFLEGYDRLRKFLVEGLKWKDDEQHTLPQMKAHRNFVLMVNAEKGILLAKDVCECIAAPTNAGYRPQVAAEHAFDLLTKETLCPPDLLERCLAEHWLPDLHFPEGDEKEGLAVQNADFIARHSLLYYYRGD